MSSSDRRAPATLALIALAGLAAIAAAVVQAGEPRERHEQRPPEGERQAARHEAEARQSHRTYPARAQAPHAAPGREASYAHQHPVAPYHREMVARGTRELSRGPGSQVRVVRYGNSVSGTVERTIRPGLMSRTFVSGGHVLYTRVYQQHVWHQYGRAFAYETVVPAVRYPAVYYSWALAAWPHPIVYAWGWQVQPWYPVYGALFTPYAVYTSPDLWMTDYIIAQSMQRAYQAQMPAPTAEPLAPGAPATPAAGSSMTVPAEPPSYAPSAPQPQDAPYAPQPSPQPSDAPPAPPSSDAPSAPTATPPAITPQVKAQLDAQIKVQLREQQAAATPATVTAQSAPPALRPNHVFFEVVQPLNVPSDTANGYCSLSANDYIKRSGGMSQDDWKIPVVVELSGPADCPQGLHTRIGLNDLNAMENEQEARVLEAMQAASKGMGPNGPPSGPGVHPGLIADGSVAPDPMALAAIRQAQ